MINWLASYPKSGNTWVRLYLEAYMTGNIDINNLRFVGGDSSGVAYYNVSPLPMNALSSYQWAMLRQAALINKVVQARWLPVILKTHTANISVPDIPLIPKGFTKNSIYLIRDPRDVLPSFSRHMGLPIDEGIERMLDNQNMILTLESEDGTTAYSKSIVTSWKNHVTSWEQVPNVLIMRYEDIKKDQDQCFEAIIKHFNIEWNQERHEFSKEMCAFELMKEIEKEEGFKESSPHNDSFFYDGKVGSFKSKITKEQEEKIINAFGELMEKYGYI